MPMGKPMACPVSVNVCGSMCAGASDQLGTDHRERHPLVQLRSNEPLARGDSFLVRLVDVLLASVVVRTLGLGGLGRGITNASAAAVMARKAAIALPATNPYVARTLGLGGLGDEGSGELCAKVSVLGRKASNLLGQFEIGNACHSILRLAMNKESQSLPLRPKQATPARNEQAQFGKESLRYRIRIRSGAR